MKLSNCVFVLQIGMIFSIYTLSAQNPLTKLSTTTIEVGEESYSGSTSSFDYPPKDVKKGLWRYCKGFGKLLNMRSYYVILIPSAMNEGNVDLKIFATIEGEDAPTQVSFALDTTGLEKGNISKLDEQCAELLRDFKVTFYNDDLQEKIDAATKQAAGLSKRYEKLVATENQEEKQDLLAEISELQTKISGWQARQLKNKQ